MVTPVYVRVRVCGRHTCEELEVEEGIVVWLFGGANSLFDGLAQWEPGCLRSCAMMKSAIYRKKLDVSGILSRGIAMVLLWGNEEV